MAHWKSGWKHVLTRPATVLYDQVPFLESDRVATGLPFFRPTILFVDTLPGDPSRQK